MVAQQTHLNGKDHIVTGIKEVPVTQQRPPAVDLDNFVKNPGVSRVNVAPSKEKPEGGDSPRNRTVLQQHVDFWDEDKDGIIYPMDTFRGFRKIGAPLWMAILAVPIIHLTFAYWTQDSWIPSPALGIYTKNIHRTKHGSDSESFDTEGRFNPQKFEECISKYDKDNKDGLNLKEIWTMTEGNRNIMDPTGWVAEKLEWFVTYYFFANDEKVLTREMMRAACDGSAYFIRARELEQKRARRGAKKLA